MFSALAHPAQSGSQQEQIQRPLNYVTAGNFGVYQSRFLGSGHVDGSLRLDGSMYFFSNNLGDAERGPAMESEAGRSAVGTSFLSSSLATSRIISRMPGILVSMSQLDGVRPVKPQSRW